MINLLVRLTTRLQTTAWMKLIGTRALEVSADYYERRWRNRIKSHQGDRWIAIGLYLLLISVAFVAL